MKNYKLSGEVNFKEAHPYMIFEVIVDAENEDQAFERVWHMFRHPDSIRWDIEEIEDE